MNRRTLLGKLAAGTTLAGLAGCLAPAATGGTDPDGGGAPTDGTAGTAAAPPVAELGIPATICEEDVSEDPGIYAVTDPAFGADWAGPTDTYGELTDDDVVIGLERGGEARAYPLSVLTIHEIVNDDLGGPVMVTYCPLCRSGLVADRRIEGRTRVFLVSGLLWKPPRLEARASEANGNVFGADGGGEARVSTSGNLVMYDRSTGSYWSQMLAKAICGPLTGTRLPILPSTVATWGEWREAHPDAEVLLPPPESGTVAPGEGGA